MNFTTMDQDNDIGLLVVVFQKTYCAVMHLSKYCPTYLQGCMETRGLDTATCVINAPDDRAAWSINSLLLYGW